MKKNLFLFLLLSFSMVSAQCYINGNAIIKVSEEATYNVENNSAQCADCYLWENSGRSIEFAGNTKQSSVKAKAISVGRSILTLSMQTAKGLVQCNKIIDVIADHSAKSPDCDIDFFSYADQKSSDGTVVFSHSNTENTYKFEWTAAYENGDLKTSVEKVPKFSYSKENGIQTATAKITSAKCTRVFTKNYDPYFWKYF